MKKTAVVFFVSLFAIGVSAQRISDLPQNKSANTPQPAQTIQTPSQDSIIFDKLEHNYGTIEKGSDGNCVFTFTNQGQKPLLLSNVRASCGCTVAEWPREPITPGKSGEIIVKYNTEIAGTFNKSITVNSNAANSMVRLGIRGQVVAPQL